jgi:pimeloyl-ACP methyl ester carboxylesterase
MKKAALKSRTHFLLALVISLVLPLSLAHPSLASNDDHILTNDFFVQHVSTVPAIYGQPVQLFVRERVLAGIAKNFRSAGANGKVVLFVHGGTYPSAPDYDVAFKDYSWMEYLAQAGFDVFAMDITGYGASTRPYPMNDPCNTSPSSVSDGVSGEDIIMPYPLTAHCPPSYPYVLATSQSDWDDVNEVVDYLRALRGVDRISLIGWSGGGPRMGGYAALYPEKVDKLVLQAPAYSRLTPTNPPSTIPRPGFPFTVSTRYHAFVDRWDIQVHCENQFDPGIRDVIWAMNMAFDPLGATWGPGVVRARTQTSWGWNASMAARVQAPTLLFSGVYDQEVAPQLVRDLFADLGTDNKVFVAVDCASHYIPYETQHEVLYKGSKDWLLHGSIKGVSRGTFSYNTNGQFVKVPE